METNKKNGTYIKIAERMKAGGAIKALMGSVKSPRISKPQLELFSIVYRIFPNAELEYNIMGVALADIAIPSLKIDIEYDGEYWHKNKHHVDKQRDEKLLKLGWETVRVNKELLKKVEMCGLLEAIPRINRHL